MTVWKREDESAWLTTGSLVVLAAVALAVVLMYTRVVMIPFVLAVFIIALVSPVLDLQVIRLKFPRPVAVVVTLLIVAVIVALLCLLVAQAVQTIIDTARPYTDSFVRLTKQVFPKLQEWGIDLSALGNEIPALVTNTLGTVLGFLSTVFFVLIFVMFLLAGRNPHIVRSGVYADIDQKVRRYIATKAIVSTLTGLMVWATLAWIGLELAGVFGILAFLLNFIPSVGSVISTLLPIPVAAAQFQNPWLIGYVVVVPGTIQMLIGNVLEPKFMGEGLHLHPITVLLALSFWGLLWGIGGMFLATPMTAIVRIILMQFDTLKPLGELLAGVLPGSEDSPEIT
jgi:AI-2 transport protein TqsA